MVTHFRSRSVLKVWSSFWFYCNFHWLCRGCDLFQDCVLLFSMHIFICRFHYWEHRSRLYLLDFQWTLSLILCYRFGKVLMNSNYATSLWLNCFELPFQSFSGSSCSDEVSTENNWENYVLFCTRFSKVLLTYLLWRFQCFKTRNCSFSSYRLFKDGFSDSFLINFTRPISLQCVPAIIS